ncbi:hypothetical protein QE422_003628 [Chryseobacterium sp. SORGH_AS 447]|uniref:hypothetical protein n=1 Tax=Chryseobacterium sp. SORGH_AS_0447 TaxID=3041769 RepID=UPI002783E2D2|nr:hypothetical protein [Chryseobacterium sp. SORGH_AS_0447]MDQ1163260.1 hypothetical protein [Chryseobacterium sp. SORGH_AS_0447]
MEKKLILCIFCLSFISIIQAQTFDDILKVTSYYKKNFSEFEKGLNLKNLDKKSKFGLESRIYNFKNSKILLESNNEENNISKFSLLTAKGEESEELWYQTVKKANSLSDFVVIQSFISSKNPDLYKEDISFSELISILRSLKNTEDLICFMVYKKDNLYYQFNLADNTFYMIVSDNYSKK